MNLAAMRTRVRRPFKWAEDDTECTALVDDAINDAYDWVNGQRRWRGLKATDVTKTISVASPTLDVPTDWRSLTGVAIISGAEVVAELGYITWDALRAAGRDPSVDTVGTPALYLLTSEASGVLGARKHVIVPYPYPNATFTVRLNGIYRPVRLTAATQVPWFDESFHAILPMYAVALLGLAEAGWDRDKCDRYMQRAIDQMEAMANDEPDGITATSVVPLVGE